MIRKLRFIEPGNYSPYKHSLINGLVYNKYIKNPSTGLVTLATIAHRKFPDTLMYSESISEIKFADVYDSDIVFLSLNTFNAVRGYEVAKRIRANSKALIVLGGMHASLNYKEAIDF
jgi:anaerobic magnesium-protoporphyrin IX monomethyl ester cyclase